MAKCRLAHLVESVCAEKCEVVVIDLVSKDGRLEVYCH